MSVASIDGKIQTIFTYFVGHIGACVSAWIFRFPASRLYRRRLDSGGALSYKNTFDTRDSRMFITGADAQFNALCIDKNTWHMRRWTRNSVSHRFWVGLLKRCTSVLPQFIGHSRGRLLNDLVWLTSCCRRTDEWRC